MARFDDVNRLTGTEDEQAQARVSDDVERLLAALQSVNDLYIQKVAEQIKTIGGLNASSINRLAIMAQMNVNIAEIKRALEKALGIIGKQLDKLLLQSFEEVGGNKAFEAFLDQPESTQKAASDRKSEGEQKPAGRPDAPDSAPDQPNKALEEGGNSIQSPVGELPENIRIELENSGLKQTDEAKEVNEPQYQEGSEAVETPEERKERVQKRLEQLAKAIAEQTNGRMQNLANTTAVGVDYARRIDAAILATTSGLSSPEEATRDAVRAVGKEGMTVTYSSGYKQNLVSAARSNILTACNQIAQQGSDLIAEETGCDCKEITVHSCPAPDHAPVQGHVLKNEEWDKMQSGQDFEDIKGHKFDGFARPIGQWNCMHFGMAFDSRYQEPKYTQEQLDKILEQNEKGFDWRGKHYTMYQGTQMMRALERKIRKEMTAAKAAADAGDEGLQAECQKRVDDLGKVYDSLSKASGLPKKPNRISVDGFKRYKGDKGPKKTEKTKSTESNGFDSGPNDLKRSSDKRSTKTMENNESPSEQTAPDDTKGPSKKSSIENGKPENQASNKRTDPDEETSKKYDVVGSLKTGFKAIESCFGKLRTDKVIYMEERQRHTLEGHPEYEGKALEVAKQVLSDPDYIYRDPKRPETVLFVKWHEEYATSMVLRLALSSGSEDYLNSIITMFVRKRKRIVTYLDKNSDLILYKKKKK